MHTSLQVPVTPEGPLRRLVRSCLDDLDELVAMFLAELRSMEPYASDAVPWPELREHAEGSMELLLRLVGGLAVPDRLADLCERIGRSRAQAGVPLEVLLHAVRFDFRVLWEAFTHRASEDELPSLVHSASRVWGAVDHHTTRIHLAYLSEAAVVAREQEHERAQLVARLLTTDARDPQVVAQVATALDVSADADFAVAAAPLPDTRPLRDAADELVARGISVHLQDVDRRPVLIAQLPTGTAVVPQRWLQDVPCGLAPIARTLAGVPHAVRIAAELAGTSAAETGPRALTDVWSSVVAGRLGELGDALAAEVIGPMRGIGAGERSRLLETAAAYLRTGSAGAVAGELYCHRNTVLNRMRRIADLTGCDLTHPDQAALFTVARACDRTSP